jgi:2'-5' RNA ligase
MVGMMIARSMYELGLSKYLPEDPIYVTVQTESPLLYPPYMDLLMFQKGSILETHPHVTLRYGILPEVPFYDVKRLVRESCNLWPPLAINTYLNSFQIFGRPEDAMDTVVIPVVNTEFLSAVHLELGCFPNVSTYPDFQPHITLGRFPKGFWETIDYQLLPPLKQQVSVLGFHIGGNGKHEDF